jgi:hypothetical protein
MVIGNGESLKANGDRLLHQFLWLQMSVRVDGMHVKVIKTGTAICLDGFKDSLQGGHILRWWLVRGRNLSKINSHDLLGNKLGIRLPTIANFN